MSRLVIAIDGPAASGKSSVARGLAAQLGIHYVNSGTMYRAITWHVLRAGVDLRDEESILPVVFSTAIRSGFENGQSFIEIDGFRPTHELREESVNQAVSTVSALPAVRSRLTNELHALARLQDCVVEGRDIGSVVFPNTPYKIYLDASAEVRQRRRSAEGQQDEVAARDRVDSSRHTAPLRIAPDAVVIDTTHLDLEATIAAVRNALLSRGLPLSTDSSISAQ